MARYGLGLPLILLLALCLTFAQNPPQSDSQAIALAAQAMVALTNRNAIGDVTANGTATWIAGSDTETGTVTLLSKGTTESRIDLNLTAGIRSEVRKETAGFPQGETITPNGNLQWAEHNCWVNANWFFPALSVLASTSDSSFIFTYVGLETRGNEAVQHLRAYRYLSGQKVPVISFTETVSTEEIYLDSTSLLPVAFTFSAHPDNDASTNIPLEIDFSNYQALNGIQIPMHVQRLISGGLALDVVLTNVVLNSGLSDGLFAIQ